MERATPDGVQLGRVVMGMQRAMASAARARIGESAGNVESQLQRLRYAAPVPEVQSGRLRGCCGNWVWP